MRVVNFSEARNSLKSLIDQVIDDADYTVIARRDAPDAVVMSLDTFNSLMETVHLLKSPANAAHLAKSIEQYRKGKLTQDTSGQGFWTAFIVKPREDIGQPSRDNRQKQKHRKQHEMHRPLHDRGLTTDDGDRTDQQRQRQ
jgi:antitoxin YefM